MDELKDKLKKFSLFGKSQSSSQAFKGKGHVLGSSAPTQAGVPAARPAPQAAAASRLPTLLVPPAPPQRPAAPPSSASASAAQAPLQHTTAISHAQPEARAVPVASAASSGSAAAGGAAAPPASLPRPPMQQPVQQQQQVQQAVGEGQEAEGVSLAVGQLASDPNGPAAADVLRKLLGNIVGAPADAKFRRVRLNNPRIQSAVVGSSGGVELLLSCGFEIVFEEAPAAAATAQAGSSSDGAAQAAEAEASTEGYAVLPADADLAPLQQALRLLEQLSPAPASSGSTARATTTATATAASPPPAQQAAGGGAAGSGSGGVAAPAPQPRPQQQQREVRQRQWDPPRERNTQVLLPTSVERDVPDWFFQRTGQELKAAFMSAVRRREQDQMLMTRAMRERMRGSPSKSVANFATVKVRFPEGISLQGEFSAGEPVAAVFAWVADCLSDPLHSYELVLPSRQPLAADPKSVREADLLPSVALLFRWTGQSAVEMAHVPALRQELLQAARPATAAY